MYSKQMQRKLDDTKVYFEEDDLRKMHNIEKSDSYARVCMIIFCLSLYILMSSLLKLKLSFLIYFYFLNI